MANPLLLRISDIRYGTTEELLAWPKAATKNQGFYNTDTGELVKGPGLYAACARRAGVDIPVTVVDTVGTSNVTIGSEVNVGDTLAGLVLTASHTVLLTGQSTGHQCGLYTPAASATRKSGYTTYNSMAGKLFYCKSGTNAGKYYRCESAAGGTIGSTDLVFTEVTNKPLVIGRLGQMATLTAKASGYAGTELITIEQADGSLRKVTLAQLKSYTTS